MPPVTAQARRSPATRPLVACGLWILAAGLGGCTDSLVTAPAPLFGAALSVNGEPVGPAVIDTGGGYEVMLRETFGLRTISTADVLAFAGRETVGITEGFRYSAGGWKATANGAIVGLSVCDCNGLGFFFFRKTGAVLGIDFANTDSLFLSGVPAGGVDIAFEPPPENLPGFDTSFVEVDVAWQRTGGAGTTLGLLDTGTNMTLVRRGVLEPPVPDGVDRLDVTITQARLGTVAIRVRLFDDNDLPDVLLGTDIMRTWADRWFFAYAPSGGTVTVFDIHAPDESEPPGGPPARKEPGR